MNSVRCKTAASARAMKGADTSLRNRVGASNVSLFEASWRQVRQLQIYLRLTLSCCFTFWLPTLWNNFKKSPQSTGPVERSWEALSCWSGGVKSIVHSCACVSEPEPVRELWFECLRCSLKFQTALHQLTGSTSWDVNTWTWATSESPTPVCHLPVVCVCVCGHLRGVCMSSLLWHVCSRSCMAEQPSASQYLPSSRFLLVCLSRSAWNSLDTLRGPDRHSAAHK